MSWWLSVTMSLWLTVAAYAFPGINFYVNKPLALTERLTAWRFTAALGQESANADLFVKEFNFKRIKGPVLTPGAVKPEIAAAAAVAIDNQSGKILFEQSADLKTPIASITKLMTALVFLEHNPGWDNKYKNAKSDHRDGGKDNFFVGEEVTVKDLFMGMLVASDNSAVISLIKAANFSEAEFVAEMNLAAARFGLSKTYFEDPTGLDNDNISTAADVAKMAGLALAKSEIQEAVLSDSYLLKVGKKSRQLRNTDKLLKVRGRSLRIHGGKTGYLTQAGYCFTGMFSQNERAITVAVLGTDSADARFSETEKIVNWVFDNYNWID